MAGPAEAAKPNYAEARKALEQQHAAELSAVQLRQSQELIRLALDYEADSEPARAFLERFQALSPRLILDAEALRPTT